MQFEPSNRSHPIPRFGALAALTLAGCGSGTRVPDRPDPARETRVVAGLLPAVVITGAPARRFALAERMRHYRAPGVTIAVADSGRIVWARGFGVKEAGGQDSVRPTTVFEAGSISKAITATATLHLVGRGTLALDRDVNDYLRSWKLPANRFTAAEPVTLRRILSHSAGLTVHGFPGYSTTDSIPTVPEILDGKRPANTDPVRVDTTPGAMYRYSGGGTTIEQLILTDVSGKRFPDLMAEVVLGPIGMVNSTFEQPLPLAWRDRASAAHDGVGAALPGRYHVYPEMAAAGLWTTPSDLLRWAIEIAAARAGTSTKVLPRAVAAEMLTVAKGSVGLGPFLGGDGIGFHFGHGGSDAGFHAELVYFPETGRGAAVMVNSDGGQSILSEILSAIAAEYGWPGYEPRKITAFTPDSAALERFVGVYRGTVPFRTAVTITRAGEVLSLRLSLIDQDMGPPTELVFSDPTTLVSVDGGYDVKAVTDRSGRVIGLELPGITVRRATRGRP